MKQIVHDKIGSVTLIEKKIIHIDIFPDVDLDVMEIDLLHQSVLQLSNNEKYAAIATSGFGSTISPAAREYSANHHSIKNYRIALAIIVDNLAHRLVGNFFIKFNKPKSPAKLFTSKDEAIEWLRVKIKAHQEQLVNEI
jgi:hypothetical protein